MKAKLILYFLLALNSIGPHSELLTAMFYAGLAGVELLHYRATRN